MELGLYQGSLRVTFDHGPHVLALPAVWDEVSLTVESSSWHEPLNRTFYTVGNQVSEDFLLPPGDATISAALHIGGDLAATGSATASIQPGPNSVTLELTTARGTLGTLAGGIASGSVDAVGPAARFARPRGLTTDAAGNVFVADYDNHRIRQIAPDGTVTTLAGSTIGYADGPGATAQFSNPSDLVYHPATNALYVADRANHRIRRINLSQVPTSATFVETFAGNGTMAIAAGNGLAASFANPWGIAVSGNDVLYVACQHAIMTVSALGDVAILAGHASPGTLDGPGNVASFNDPRDVTLDEAGNAYVADTGNHLIRMIDPQGNVSTLAGKAPPSSLSATASGWVGGSPGDASFYAPNAIAWHPSPGGSGCLLVADTNQDALREIHLDRHPLDPEGFVTIFLGGLGTGSANGTAWLDANPGNATLNRPWGLWVDPSRTLYVADGGNHSIRKGIPAGLGGGASGSVSN